MGFGSKLRELREAKGLSRKELADIAGMKSEAGIRDLEQGVRQPTWDTVRKLAHALGASCEQFDVDDEDATDEPARKPGRPPKPPSGEAAVPKKSRGRPRKET